MPMMDDLTEELTAAVVAQQAHHTDVSDSDLEGRRDTPPTPPGADLGAPPVGLIGEWQTGDGSN